MTAEALLSFVRSQRWFRSKDKKILGLKVVDEHRWREGSRQYALLFLNVRLEKGHETYFLPLVSQGKKLEIQDASSDKGFALWLWNRVQHDVSLPTRRGRLLFTSGSLPKLSARPSVFPVSGEQSNTSIVYEKKAIVKIFRKLEPGQNPEPEMLGFLRAHGFSFVPEPLAEIRYQGLKGGTTLLAFFQGFVQSRGDGWRVLLDHLNVQRKHPQKENRELSRLIQELAERTADMHRTLASEARDPAFAPEPVSREDVKRWRRHYDGQASSVFRALEKRGKQILPASIRSWIRSQSWAFALARGKGFQKIRCHGDYHLGQTLEGQKGFVIFDFEGPPALPLSLRREKHCALKDVAGMLRSFHYAACVAAGSKTDRFFTAWESRAREIFLKSYWERAHESTFLGDRSSSLRLLRAFELEKSLYELHYEWNNRPDWAHVPLEGIRKLFALGDKL